MEKQIRAALVGFGTMGRNYAAMLHYGMAPHMKLVGVCCRNEAGQQVLREKFPGVSVYADTEAMAACQEEYDAVIIVTPHTTHVPIAMQFAKLGKHILMDKPAGISAGEVKALTDYCSAHDLAFGMIFHNRQLPAFRLAKDYLDDGRLGTLHRAVWVCNSWYRSPAYHRSGAWRSSWNGECGGLMMNQNPHYLDIWQWLFGMPRCIYADMEFGRYNDFKVDDAVDIQFSYDNGFHGTLVSATGEAPGINRLEIWGSKGKLTVIDGSWVVFDANRVSTEEFACSNQEPFGFIPHEEKDLSPEPLENPYPPVFENFALHLLEGEPLAATGCDGLKTTQLINASYVSGWEGRCVTVPVEEACYLAGLSQRKEMENK